MPIVDGQWPYEISIIDFNGNSIGDFNESTNSFIADSLPGSWDYDGNGDPDGLYTIIITDDDA